MPSSVRYIPARNDRLERNVGIYCRVSTNSREQLDSLAEQVSALTRRVAHIDQWRLADVFIDVASARGDKPRKQFERMLQMCDQHQLSVIITKSISRFGRDTVDTLDALRRLKRAGVRVIFEEENLDTEEMESELIFTTMEACAQSENESRSENIRWGLSTAAARGTSGLYKRKVYGYDKDTDGNLVINEKQAKVVRDIFRWYLDGASVVGIVKKLAEAGIPSPTGKEKWSKHAIEKMLDNEKYSGTVILADSMNSDHAYSLEEAHPPIITDSEFRAVQQERAKRSNLVKDENGTHRSSKKYSSKKKQ